MTSPWFRLCRDRERSILDSMEELKNLDSLDLREQKTYDVPANWKLKPVLCLTDISNRELYYVVLEKGSMYLDQAFKSAHSFTLYLVGRQGNETLILKRKAGLFTNKMEVFKGPENFLGIIQKSGIPTKNQFQVFDITKEIRFAIEEVTGLPDVFHIMKNGKTVGKISRKLVRMVEEGASGPDHFGIIFPFDADLQQRCLLLGALLLIDFLR